jgi:hypothetical protein
MVKIQGSSDEVLLDKLIHELVAKHGFYLDVTGWTRKTYNVYRSSGRGGPTRLLAQIESFVTTSGEIVVFEDEALPFAEELGGAIEKQLGVKEAVLLRRPPPI